MHISKKRAHIQPFPCAHMEKQGQGEQQHDPVQDAAGRKAWWTGTPLSLNYV